MVSALEKKIHH